MNQRPRPIPHRPIRISLPLDTQALFVPFGGLVAGEIDHGDDAQDYENHGADGDAGDGARGEAVGEVGLRGAAEGVGGHRVVRRVVEFEEW